MAAGFLSFLRVAGQLVTLKTLQLPMHPTVPLGPASTEPT